MNERGMRHHAEEPAESAKPESGVRPVGASQDDAPESTAPRSLHRSADSLGKMMEVRAEMQREHDSRINGFEAAMAEVGADNLITQLIDDGDREIAQLFAETFAKKLTPEQRDRLKDGIMELFYDDNPQLKPRA